MIVLVSSACTPSAERSSAPPATGNGTGVTNAVSTVCGVADPASIGAKAGIAPLAKAFSSLVPGLPNSDDARFGSAQIAAGNLYVTVLQSGRTTIHKYSLTGTSHGTHSLPVNTVSSDASRNQEFALAADGTVYLPDFTGGAERVSAFSAGGTKIWDADLSSLGDIRAVFGWQDDGGRFAVGVAFGDRVVRLDTSGRQLGQPMAVVGDVISPQPDGTLLTGASDDDGGYAQVYSRSGVLLHRFGSAKPETVAGSGQVPSVGAIATFSGLSGMTRLADGTLLLADAGTGLRHTTDAGLSLGLIPDQYENAFTLATGTPLLSSGGRVFFAGTTDNGTKVSILAMNQAAVTTQLHQGAFFTEDTAPLVAALGLGAGLTTAATDNYFAAGRTPAVSAVFDPWWQAIAAGLSLTYTVTGPPVGEQVPVLSSGTANLPAAGAALPLTLPPPTPGAFEVQALLIDRTTGTVRGSTCLMYAVGAPGQQLDLDALPGEPDWGGAPPDRAVALAAQLGAKQYRWSLSFDDLVPDFHEPATVNRLRLTSDSGDDLVAGLESAARRAKAAGVSFLVQMSQGDDTARSAVEAGTWEGWVRAIVGVFAQRAPDVTVWSPWNEPNNTGFGSGKDYARNVLIPFARAVKSIEPSATVVGGESLNVSPDWWRSLAAGGGCAALDVVGIHPYSDFDQSWEESRIVGVGGQLEALRTVLASCGAGGKPIWDTESGWTSDGARSAWGQADSLARAAIWMHVYGISQWNYFITEGGFGDSGLSLSLIQYRSHVKPAALAYATSNSLLSGRGRPTVLDSGIPGAYAMRFAPGAGQDSQLLALWSDDLDVGAQLVLRSAAAVQLQVIDEYGARRSVQARPGIPVDLGLSGSVSYVQAPVGADLAVRPGAGFGPDLLQGARVAASSTASGSSAAKALSTDLNNPDPWTTGSTDSTGHTDISPELTITLARTETLDRVLVAGQSILCCTAGLRSFTVEVKGADGNWVQVAAASGLFFQRAVLLGFAPVQAVALRIRIGTRMENGVEVMDVNYSGQLGGLHPAWWPLAAESNKLLSIRSVQAFGG